MVYIDDILITSDSEAEHLQTLDAVLRRLSMAGLRFQKEKCIFMAPLVTYLSPDWCCWFASPTWKSTRDPGSSNTT